MKGTIHRAWPPATMMLLFIALATSAAAESKVGRFYEQKAATTTREAFERASARLDEVAPGMSERHFLEAMNVSVLAHNGRPVDAMLDGYLAECSNQANRTEPDRRHLVFGYREQGREVPRFLVALRDHRVLEVRPLGNALNAEHDHSANDR